VFAKLAALTGSDIVTGKATEPAKQIADKYSSSPFAADFTAGQGGLMIPAAAIGVVSAVVIPVVLRAIGAAPASADTPTNDGDPTADGRPTGPAMNNGDLTALLVRAYVEEAYPQWKAEHKGKTCPDKLDDLAHYFGQNPGVPVLEDGWGHPLQMKCDAKSGLAVVSLGPDGTSGTADDIHAP
jgi:hypothetical protein